MNDWLTLIMTLGLLYIGFCCLMVITDIAKAVYHQFKGEGYEWYTVKVLREKREWWKWVIAAAVFTAGLYWLLPSSIVGKEDFRALKQKAAYTAYYECEYNIEHFEKGTGYAEIRKSNHEFTIVKIFTESGIVLVDYTLTEDDDLEYSVGLSFCYEDDSWIKLGEGPVLREEMGTIGTDVVFGYPDPTREYCLACRSCGAGYYAGCIDSSMWLCPQCTDECKTSCAVCFEICPPWQTGDDYVICEYCLSSGFQDEDLRYFFITGEWP